MTRRFSLRDSISRPDVIDIPRAPQSRRLNPTADVMRFRVTLQHVEPAIWRVFDIPANLRLPVLSDTILEAMGWKNSHLHQFGVGRLRIGMRNPEGDDPYLSIDESDVYIAALFYDRGDTCVYQYDFGDWWQHTVQLLDFFPREKGEKYPLLVDGARACPPEDFGGPYVYMEFLNSGKQIPRFDPEAFNFTAARNRVRKVRY